MKLFLQFLAAMLVGTAIGAYALPKLGNQNITPVDNQRSVSISANSDASDSIIDTLQRQLLQASKERKQLEQQIAQLRQQRIEDKPLFNSEQPAIFDETGSGNEIEPEPSRAELIERVRQARSPEARRQRLLDAGFSQNEIFNIENAEARHQTDRIEARLTQMRENPEAFEQQLDPRGYQPIREELGDERFEEYLRASGRNPDVITRNVLPGSAAELAGIQSGDQIYTYDGNRIFQAGDVTRGTISGNLNESVIIEVKRNNEIVSLTAPRGTLGVTLGSNQRGGRFGGRGGP